jgi:hypothetical protein
MSMSQSSPMQMNTPLQYAWEEICFFFQQSHLFEQEHITTKLSKQ